jgi:hypothetical protein
MRTAFFLLIASVGTIYGQQQPQLSEPLKWTEPVPAQIVGEIPPGWEIVELKEHNRDGTQTTVKTTHGPFQLPDGQMVTLTTPKYVLQPILDSEHAALYLLEPGFNPKDISGNPRAGTLSYLLYIEMEALRVSSENLRPLMAQIAKVQEYVQQQQSGSATVPLPGLNPGSQQIEQQSPEITPVASPVPTPAPAATPSPSPSNSPPPGPSESSPTPSPSPSATPARTRHAKKLQKTTSHPAGDAASTPSPEPTPTPKKRWF